MHTALQSSNMGGCESCEQAQSVQGGQDQFDAGLAKEAEEQKNHFKILLLGAGESGKSTIIKQLSLLYRKGGIMEDRRQFVRVLQNNTLVCMQALLRAAEQFEYDDKTNPEYVNDATLIMGTEGNDVMTEQMVEAVKRLWASEAIQKTYLHRNQFWILETADYYFENCHRFVEENFLPNDVDVIMARKRTTGVIVTEFPVDGYNFSVVDVGGQRSERRKWINCFDGVRAIFWVSNLAGYDKVLFEDKSINRMHEDLDLFKETLKTPAFKDTPIFLFFNKKDLFDISIQSSNIDLCFPEYTGPQEADAAQQYIAEQFQEALPPGKTIEMVHFLSAKKKDEVKGAFERVKDYLIAQNRKRG